tara:strand:- start:17785 stop:18225 length:441 start_codon:yes stop_codon:yes gene_type:complete
MNPRTSKAKGRRLQNWVRDKLRYAFITAWSKIPKLEEEDIKSQTMGMPGEDIILTPAAKRIIPYSFECKNVEKLNVWSAIEQAETNCPSKCTPVTVIKRNRSKVYAIMQFDDWMKLIGGKNEPVQVSNSKSRSSKSNGSSNHSLGS